jgi:hypothetical protein
MAEGRLGQEVVAEHRRLDALFAAVREAFVARRDAAAVSRAIERLQEALELHFLQEDELYPSLWALHPGGRARLEACVAEHRHLRGLTTDLGGRAVRGELAGAVQVFEALAEDFRRHEVREEEALRDLEREPAAAG